METTLFLLLAATFATIGSLPIGYFGGDRRLNVRWWLMATPFFVAPVAVAVSFFGILPAWAPPAPLAKLLAAGASLAAIGSIGLIAYTAGSHRRAPALWHQSDDAPAEIVTWGAYSRVRHPFYSAFLLAFSAAVLAAPTFVTIACLAWAGVGLSLTARQEERRLLASRFGDAYGAYMARTGRFLPSRG